MKKALAGILSASLALSLLAGCGASAATDSTAPAADTGDTMPAAASANFDASHEITVVSREDGSGTRGAFIELLGVEVKDDDGNKVDMTTTEAVTVNSTSVVMSTVAGDPYAIGYISLGSLDDSVKALDIDGVAATVENIKNDSYAVARPFNVVTGGALSEVAQDFMDFIMSSEGQAVIEENKYIAVDESAPAYVGNKPAGKVVVAGSSSVSPVMEKLKEAYLVINPNAEVEIQTSDSSTGVQAAIDGTCDIGMASRELKDSEIEAGVAATVIAMDGIAVVVNNANPISDMSAEQVRQIFTGEVFTWAIVE